jgi:hypothetical protein
MAQGKKKNDGHGEKAMARKRKNNGQGVSVSTKREKSEGHGKRENVGLRSEKE